MVHFAIRTAVSLLVLHLLGLCPHSTVQESSPGYTFEWRGFVYKVVLKRDSSRSWEDAEEICSQQQNGHLASLLTDAESRWLNSVIQRASGQVQGTQEVWIGATDKGRLGQYKWIDGKPFKYATALLQDGTKKHVEEDEYEKCLLLTSQPDGMKVSKEDCITGRGYICKTDGIPPRIGEYERFGYEFNFTSFVYKFYVVQDEWLTWNEAEIYCRVSEYGHLLSIGGEKQAKAISNIVQLLRWMTGFPRMWIGASGLGEKNYSWTDRRQFTYTNWGEGEPVEGRGKRCLAMKTNPQWGMWTDQACTQNLPFACKIPACSTRVDIVFALDSSGSMSRENWELEKRAVKRLTTIFRIGKDASRVAVIRISTRPKIMINFRSTDNMTNLRTRIDRIPYKEGGTKTHKALKLARMKIFEKESRPGVYKLLLLITDGVSEYQEGVAQEAKRMRKSGVYMMAIGVGKRINKAELLSVASTPQDSIIVNTFEELYDRVDLLKIRLCGDHARVDEQDITFSPPGV